MKKTMMVLLLSLLVGGSTLFAQGLGLRAGLNFQNLTGDGVEDGKMAPRFNIGVDYEIAVAPDFYFAPGLLFATKGTKQEYEESLELFGESIEVSFSDDITISYLEVPLNLVYKPMLGDGNLIVAFGPYLGYAVGGKVKWEESAEGATESGEDDLEFGSGDNEVKAFDMGANLGFGYMFGGGLSLQFNTQLGLVSISNGDDAIKNTGFGLSLGYRF